MTAQDISVDISIVMPAYNAEKYIGEAIDSILDQSFSNFECIIVDDGSTDSTRDIINSYEDNRIILIENTHDFIRSLNIGMNEAKGKYIARMDADDIMHPDRLKIQYVIMEAEPSITVCSTWLQMIGENVPLNSFYGTYNGFVEQPLLALLKKCFVTHPSTMIRSEFLQKYKLQYEQEYIYAEDYKLWTEIAIRGGVFYVESQPLLFYRLSSSQVSRKKNAQQQSTAFRIRNEILEYILRDTPEFVSVLTEIRKLQMLNLMTENDVLDFFYTLLHLNKGKLYTK